MGNIRINKITTLVIEKKSATLKINILNNVSVPSTLSLFFMTKYKSVSAAVLLDSITEVWMFEGRLFLTVP